MRKLSFLTIALLGLSLFLVSIVFGQELKYGRNWVLRQNCGINFSNLEKPRYFEIKTSQINCALVLASISDRSGNLVAFLDHDQYPGSNSCGGLVRNRLGEAMVNGNIKSYLPSTSSCFFIPFEGDSNLYHLFTLNCDTITYDPIGDPTLLYHNIIDVSADNNRGAVIKKDERVLDSYVTCNVSCVKHANGRDWWILTHELKTDRYIRFLLTNNKLEGPYFQSVGLYPFPLERFNSLLWLGAASFSKKGNYFVKNYWFLGLEEVFSFDRCSGFLTLLDTIHGQYYETEHYGLTPKMNTVTENEKYLYTSDAKDIYRFKLKDNFFDKKSKEWVGNILLEKDTAYKIINNIFGSTLGPDNKIYITPYLNFPSNEFTTSLSVIHAPEADDPDLRVSDFSLHGNKIGNATPDMPNYNLGPIIGEVAEAGSDVLVCIGDSVQLGSPPKRPHLSYKWYPEKGLSSPNVAQPIAKPSEKTVYQLTVTDSMASDCNVAYDDVTVTIQNEFMPESQNWVDTIYIPYDKKRIILNATNRDANYQWSTGEVSGSIEIFSEGIYSVTTTDNAGNRCARIDSVIVKKMKDLVFPNLITPNNDGVNDFLFFNTYDFTLEEFRVFDRWGQIIYKTHTFPIEWKPVQINMGVYFYQMTIWDEKKKHKTRSGQITVIK